MMISRLIILFLLFAFGCKSGEGTIDVEHPEESLFSYRMGLIDESVPKSVDKDYFRLGIAYPRKSFIFGVVDLGDKYLIYEKVMQKQSWTSYASSGNIVLKSEYAMPIDSLVSLMKEIPVNRFLQDGSLLNDGGTWFVDYQLDYTKGKMDGVLLDDIKYLQEVLQVRPFKIPDFGQE